jgi:hypothetical protein
MKTSIDHAMRALAYMLEAHWREFDRETSAVLVALQDYVNKHRPEGGA